MMTQRLTKQLGILFSVILVFAQLSFMQPVTSEAAVLDQAITITAVEASSDEAIINTTAVEIEDGDTAWDVLEEAADSLDYEESEWGNMLQGINGVVADFDKDSRYWGFSINGKPASVGLDSYQVQHGDNLLLTLTTDLEEVNNVTVTALDEKEKVVVEETEVDVVEYATAYDAIAQAIDVMDVSVDSEFFTSVNNITKFDKADNQFWEIASNDEPLSVGALSHQVEPGEHIQLRLQTFAPPEDSSDPEESEEPSNENENKNNDNDDEKENTEEEQDKPVETPEKDTGHQEENESVDDSSEEKEQEKEASNSLSAETEKQIQSDISFLVNKVKKEKLATEYGDEWWVWGLGVAGENAPTSYLTSIEKVVKENNGDFGSVTELEKVILALSMQGYDATDIAGVNLVDLLMDNDALDTPMINAAIYALIAVNSGDYNVNTKKENALIQSIIDREVSDGGWAFFGDTPSVDITGMALLALAPYKDRPEVNEKINRAIEFLSDAQADNGGYYEEFSGGYSSEAAAQAIIGLLVVGENPIGKSFTKENGNLINYLLPFKTEDGYRHLLEDEGANAFSSQQALLALAYYQNDLQGINPNLKPKPDPNKEKPKKEDVKSDEKTEKEVTTDTDEKVKEEKEVTIDDNKIENENTSSETEQKEHENTTDTEKNKDTLPNTATNIFNWMLIGLVLVVAGMVLILIKKRKQ